MSKATGLNEYFSLDDHIGTVISEAEFQCLMAEKRIFTTSCRMDRAQAHKAMGGDIMRFPDDERSYTGLIITTNPEDFAEAETIAGLRGFNEKIDMVLDGIIDVGHELINPYNTSNQKQ